MRLYMPNYLLVPIRNLFRLLALSIRLRFLICIRFVHAVASLLR